MRQLLTPDSRLVLEYVAEFESDPSLSAADKGLTRLFCIFPDNDKLDEVLLKVAALNSLYSTNIYAVTAAAQHVVDLHIDDGLSQRSPDIVDRIARLDVGNGKSRFNYSFASKYCSWHVPTHYPIYDTYVDLTLWTYRARDRFADFRREDMRIYRDFVRIHDAFRESYGLQDMTPKEVDKFLWLFGKELARKEQSL